MQTSDNVGIFRQYTISFSSSGLDSRGLYYTILPIRNLWENGRFHGKLVTFWLGHIQASRLAYNEVRRFIGNVFIVQAPGIKEHV